MHGRRQPVRRASPGHRREPLRDNVRWRGLRRRHGLQNHPERHADDAIQLLLPNRMHGRRRPYAGLVQATDGDFYGTTPMWRGRRLWDGLQPNAGLGPFVETQPTAGQVGAAVKILGTDLTGATSVSFNGTAAVFTVVSPSLITTTVPAGATTGTVQVVTPTHPTARFRAMCPSGCHRKPHFSTRVPGPICASPVALCAPRFLPHSLQPLQPRLTRACHTRTIKQWKCFRPKIRKRNCPNSPSEPGAERMT